VREHAEAAEHNLEQGLRQRNGIANPLPRRVQQIGRSIIRSDNSSQTRMSFENKKATSKAPTTGSTSQKASRAPSPKRTSQDQDGVELADRSLSLPVQLNQRSIRFPDEQTKEPASAA
jgi:hypothetical protein